ncbi:GNAT family N-acetyltransferase [Rhodobacter capsulatus]|uniref:GNAT family N-acetyltransferase n=1 Tax=Rhodobacter capsulatus TaxID=1061 RepID=UPI0006DCFDE4|nr:GNAT family protein [Rhodobacter capsulatus]KQB13271.1 GNAT family acetyltransferase [Rhodobacter capsulatus]KQB13530.1 GNAT family acetyltransferase [Rhodobacter capsulatus]PZX24253.1 RimJ/RimL family protein N-acetyltransferase [Rhodobacter capsulatus]QNR63769.1 GNAT family N-acetyltransferase [Rhodobacter capsulatus]
MKRFGEAVTGWAAPRFPDAKVIDGRACRLERLEERHADALFRANSEDDAIWDYLPYGPFPSEAGYIRWVGDMAASHDPLFYAVVEKETGLASGVMSYLRITPDMGVIELGHINLSRRLSRSTAATEAMILMMSWAFRAGYRRFEWKCDALNIPSRRAAERLGLSYEGIFRQAAIVKGRNRDTAWFAATDKDWPGLQEAYEAWLSPSNFDAKGHQIERLSDLTRLVRVTSDPVLAGQ